MIDLITGLPGNSKTLYTIGMVRAWAEKENRPVFYSGIPELTLDWQEIDPLKWMDCPKGSIVVIDECQRIFRNRSLGATPPAHVVALETHRHLGIDLVFITQHPSLVDPAIRKLTERHRHLVRIMGMEMATVHEWQGVKDSCEKPASRKDSEKTRYAFDKSVFALYKSSELHTFKRRISGRLKLLIVLPFILAGLVWYVYSFIAGKTRAVAPPPVVSAVAGSPALLPGGVGPLNASGGGRAVVPFDPIADAKMFIAQNTPRVQGLPQTAPKYDQLTMPTRVPVPSACIQSESACRCFTQQGTAMDVQKDMCVSFARNGFFQEFDPDRERADSARSARGAEVLRSSPIGSPIPSPAGQVVAFSEGSGLTR